MKKKKMPPRIAHLIIIPVVEYQNPSRKHSMVPSTYSTQYLRVNTMVITMYYRILSKAEKKIREGRREKNEQAPPGRRRVQREGRKEAGRQQKLRFEGGQESGVTGRACF